MNYHEWNTVLNQRRDCAFLGKLETVSCGFDMNKTKSNLVGHYHRNHSQPEATQMTASEQRMSSSTEWLVADPEAKNQKSGTKIMKKKYWISDAWVKIVKN